MKPSVGGRRIDRRTEYYLNKSDRATAVRRQTYARAARAPRSPAGRVALARATAERTRSPVHGSVDSQAARNGVPSRLPLHSLHSAQSSLSSLALSRRCPSSHAKFSPHSTNDAAVITHPGALTKTFAHRQTKTRRGRSHLTSRRQNGGGAYSVRATVVARSATADVLHAHGGARLGLLVHALVAHICRQAHGASRGCAARRAVVLRDPVARDDLLADGAADAQRRRGWRCRSRGSRGTR